MSNTDHSTTQLETTGTTTLPPPPPHQDRDSLNRRLDIISVAIICGVIVVCFVVCFIVGCRRTKRRRPPRCQDVSTPTVEPSHSGIVLIIPLLLSLLVMAKVRRSTPERHSATSNFSRVVLRHLYFSRGEFQFKQIRKYRAP